MRSLLFSTAALAAALPSLTHAEDATALDEIVVTAARLPARPDEITGARVIDRPEIEARQSVFLTDLLTTVPGVGITRNGAFGGVAAIRIRGASADKTLVLVDGVPAGDPADPNGAFDASSLQTADVERIEVLSGPQGSLWGSEAIGGVVSITTRELAGARLEAEGGSLATARGYVGAGVSREGHGLNASIAGFRTDGVSKAASGTEDDGFRTLSATIGGRWKLSEAVRLDGRVRYGRSRVEIDGYPPPAFELADTSDLNRSHSWSGFGRATIAALGLTHELSFSDYELTRTSVSAFPSRYSADRQVWRWTAAHGAADDALSYVAGAERSDTSANLDGRPSTDLSASSVFAVARGRIGPALTLTGAVRYDDPDSFKARATGRLSAAWRAGRGLTVTGAVGQGFKVPTISQVICDFCYAPPVALRPERAEGWDLRLGWASGDGRLSGALTGYRLRVRDQISYVAGRYVNIARTRSTGVEAEAEAQLSDSLRLKLAYANMDAVDRASGASLLRTPDHSGAASLFWNQDRWEGALTVRGESRQSDTDRDGFSPKVRKGFVTADLAAGYRLSERVTLTARIENLTGRRYSETLGYGEPGRTAYVGVRLRN